MSKRQGIKGDGAGGRIIGALARIPESQLKRGRDRSDSALEGSKSSDHVRLVETINRGLFHIRLDPGRNQEPERSSLPEVGSTVRQDPYRAGELIEIRIIARDFMRALSKVLDFSHALSEKTGIILDVKAVAEAARELVQALDAVRDLAMALDEAGTGELRQELRADSSFDLVEILGVAEKLVRVRDGISTLAHIIDGMGLAAPPGDAVRGWELPQILDDLSPAFTTVTELVRGLHARGLVDSPGMSRIGEDADALISTSRELREVARSANELSRELDRAGKIAKSLASTKFDISSVPADLLSVADEIAREFKIRDIIRARSAAYAMSELLRVIDEIREHASAVSKARSLNDALSVRSLLNRLTTLETTFNYVRAAPTNIEVPPRTDDVTRAIWQINRLATSNIDASGADLHHLEFRDLDVLAGVTWTYATIWPPGIRKEIRARSDEIRPGFYRVRDGNDRDPADLVVGI